LWLRLRRRHAFALLVTFARLALSRQTGGLAPLVPIPTLQVQLLMPVRTPLSCSCNCYLPAASLQRASACPQGYYCPSASVAGTPCPSGTFGAALSLPDVSSCSLCTPGSVCSASALLAPNAPCNPGYFCPLGTVNPSQYPCLAGTYTDATDGTQASHCQACPVRFACPAGTGGSTAPGVWCRVLLSDRHPGKFTNESFAVHHSLPTIVSATVPTQYACPRDPTQRARLSPPPPNALRVPEAATAWRPCGCLRSATRSHWCLLQQGR